MSLDSYVRTHATTWTDDDYRDLPQAAKALYTQLLSSPTRNTLGIGDWDLEEFVAFDPDTSPDSVIAAMNVLIERHYVVLERRTYIVRSYLRHNQHLIKNPKNAAGLVRRFRETFSKNLRHVVLHELNRLREEQPSLSGWAPLREVFDGAKFDYTETPPPSDRATGPSTHRPSDRTSSPGNGPQGDRTTDRVADPIGRLEEEKKEEGKKPDSASGQTQSLKKAPTPERFDEFWDVYAYKEGRKLSLERYKAALKKKGVTEELLIGAAREYIAFKRADGKHPEYTKLPATWLSGEHWNDERASRATASSGSAPLPTPSLPHWSDIEDPPDHLSTPEEVTEWMHEQERKRRERNAG